MSSTIKSADGRVIAVRHICSAELTRVPIDKWAVKVELTSGTTVFLDDGGSKDSAVNLLETIKSAMACE
jgi:hypothetical protein